jgi:hypothetical protein
MDLPPLLHKVMHEAASRSTCDTARRLGVQSRAFWQWAICELDMELNDDVWALVPEDLKKDRDFLILAANWNCYVWKKLGAFAHDVDFFKALNLDSFRDCDIDPDYFDPLFETFAPCFQTYDGAVAMAKYFGCIYLHFELPEDHWSRSDVDVALAWLRVDGGYFGMLTPHLRRMEVVWKTALQHRTRCCHANDFPEHVLQTRAYVLQLAEVDEQTLKYAPAFADDEEVARRVLKTGLRAHETLSPRLRNDRALLLRALREATPNQLQCFRQSLPYKDDLEMKAHVARGFANARGLFFDERSWLRGVVHECLRAVETDDARVELYTEVLATHMSRFPELESKITRAIERVYHPDGRVHTGDKRAYAEAFRVVA